MSQDKIYAVAECLSTKIIQIHYDDITDLDMAKAHKRSLQVLCKNPIIILTEVV